MWWDAVKFGGDSGAMREVSDIETGFERLSSTAGSRRCHGIGVKGYICEWDARQPRFRAARLRSGRRPGTADAQGRGAIRFASVDSSTQSRCTVAVIPGRAARASRPNGNKWESGGSESDRAPACASAVSGRHPTAAERLGTAVGEHRIRRYIP